MQNKYFDDYMERLTSFSQKAKEENENDKFSYYQKMFSFLKAAKSDVQTVYEECITEAVKEDDFENVYRVFPEELPVSNNGYPMYIHGTNILLCLLYNSENKKVYPADKIVEKAEKFTASKKPLWERLVILCLLGILQGDAAKISDGLQQVCVGFTKVDAAKYMKMQCQNAYGLLVLAKHFLSEEKFAQIKYPECKNFSKNYISWFLEQNVLLEELCITYAPPIDELNEIFRKQIAITRIHQPYLNSDNSFLSARDKKAYYMDTDKMLKEFLQ